MTARTAFAGDDEQPVRRRAEGDPAAVDASERIPTLGLSGLTVR